MRCRPALNIHTFLFCIDVTKIGCVKYALYNAYVIIGHSEILVPLMLLIV